MLTHPTKMIFILVRNMPVDLSYDLYFLCILSHENKGPVHYKKYYVLNVTLKKINKT